MSNMSQTVCMFRFEISAETQDDKDPRTYELASLSAKVSAKSRSMRSSAETVEISSIHVAGLIPSVSLGTPWILWKYSVRVWESFPVEPL